MNEVVRKERNLMKRHLARYSQYIWTVDCLFGAAGIMGMIMVCLGVKTGAYVALAVYTLLFSIRLVFSYQCWKARKTMMRQKQKELYHKLRQPSIFED